MESRLTDYFLSLVKIGSESRNELELALKIKEDLETLGAKVVFDDSAGKTGSNAGNLCAFIQGEPDIEPIMLCAHLDTVVPGNNVNPVIKEGIIYTDGTTILGADDKSGIAEIIWGLKLIKESGQPHPPIEILFTVCEEIGLLGAKSCNLSRFKAKRCYAFDSHEVGTVMLGAPSQNNLLITVKGKKAHAGVEPEKGVNAILVAAEAITKIPLGRIDEETTSNVGIIEGGKATNIVPDSVMIKGEVRSHSEAKLSKITDEICSIFTETASKYQNGSFSASVDVKVTTSYNSFYVDESDDLVEIAKQASERMGIEFQAYRGGGGSDANILNGKGIRSVVIGTGMNDVHTSDENISISSLEKGAEWVKELLLLLGSNNS